jgi:hypothetical protein
MRLPETVNASWIATLGNEQLEEAEAKLHAQFRTQEKREKARAGDRYSMMRGPEPLISAWHRWLMVNNEALHRGMVLRRTPKA